MAWLVALTALHPFYVIIAGTLVPAAAVVAATWILWAATQSRRARQLGAAGYPV